MAGPFVYANPDIGDFRQVRTPIGTKLAQQEKQRQIEHPEVGTGLLEAITPPKVELHPKATVAPEPAFDPSVNGETEVGQPDENQGSNDILNKLREEMGANARQYAVPGGGPQADPNTILGEGETFHLYGGREGKKNYNQAFDTGPTEDAIRKGQVAKEAQNEAVVEHYKNETIRQQEQMAVQAAQRQKDQQEEARRVADLDEKTQNYSNDLAQQGKFWHSPGNIIAAISYSLMPIFSKDATVGIRLIDNAVERDMANRKHLADMHLGELRSNLGSYRKMVGDRQAGDMLAESEARRIAAMDIERIGASFSSPISRAQMETLIADQQNKAAALKMQAYRLGVYVPTQVKPKAVAADIIASGKATGVGYSSFAGDKNANVAGHVNGSPSTASNTERRGTLPTTRLVALAANPDEAVKQAARGTLPKEDIHDVYNRYLVHKLSKQHQIGTPAFAEAMSKIQIADQQAEGEISKLVHDKVGDHAKLRSLQSDVGYVDASFRSKGINPNKFLDDVRTWAPDKVSDTVRDLQSRYSDPSTKEGKEDLKRIQAVNRLYQKLGGAVSAYKHANIGGAQSTTELVGVSKYIDSNPSWEKLTGFIQSESEAAQSQIENSVEASTSLGGKLLWYSHNNKSTLPRVDSPTIPQRPKGYDPDFTKGTAVSRTPTKE